MGSQFGRINVLSKRSLALDGIGIDETVAGGVVTAATVVSAGQGYVVTDIQNLFGVFLRLKKAIHAGVDQHLLNTQGIDVFSGQLGDEHGKSPTGTA